MYYFFSAPGSGIATVKVLRGLSAPKGMGGSAKWEVNDRPKRVGSTRYVGTDPRRMAVPILFNGWTRNKTSVEGDIARLMLMQQEVNGTPPIVNVGPGVPFPDVDWVIESTEWGDQSVIWDYDDNNELVRYRQEATVNLLERVAAGTLAISSKTAGITRGTGGGGTKPRNYRVKNGDTLGSIALHELGKRSRWGEIAKRNNITNPKSIFVGQVLVIP